MSLCATARQLPAESVDFPRAYASEEQCSLYATSESKPEEAPDMEVNKDADACVESLEHMKCSFVALVATQSMIVDKLATLEKLVGFVQEDVTWV
jgi:hypothetical protein